MTEARVKRLLVLKKVTKSRSDRTNDTTRVLPGEGIGGPGRGSREEWSGRRGAPNEERRDMEAVIQNLNKQATTKPGNNE